MLHKRASEAFVANENSDKSISSDLASSPIKKRRIDIADSASDKSSIVASGSSSSGGFNGDSVVQQLDMAFGNSNRQEIDEDLHSRQLAVYGRETMRRLFASNVLISGMHGLGAEIENSPSVNFSSTTDVNSSFSKELYGESLQLSKPRNDDHNSLEDLEGSFFGSSDEEPSDTYPINKDTEKMLEEFHMSGYRDGIIAGKEAAAQQGYNIGYKESVLDGYKFGIVRGVSSALAFLPSELREKLIDEQETRDKFQKLHGSVHGLSTEAAMKLFYGTLTTTQGEEKSGEEGSSSGLGLGSGSVSGSGVAATTDLGSYVTELSSLLDKSPKIEVNLDT